MPRKQTFRSFLQTFTCRNKSARLAEYIRAAVYLNFRNIRLRKISEIYIRTITTFWGDYSVCLCRRYAKIRYTFMVVKNGQVFLCCSSQLSRNSKRTLKDFAIGFLKSIGRNWKKAISIPLLISGSFFWKNVMMLMFFLLFTYLLRSDISELILSRDIFH